MNRWHALPLLALLGLSPGALAESTGEKVIQLQQQMAVMQGELNSLIAVQQASKGSQSALADVLTRTQRLEQEVRTLRGDLETQTHQLQSAQQALADKVNALAEQQAATSATASTASTASAAPAAALISPATALANAATSTTSSALPGMGQADYQRAFDLLRQGKYGAAVTGLQDFIRKYPQSSLMPDAYYWLGQAQYVLGQNDAALRSLYAVQVRFPQSSKAPEAMLRIAEIYQAIGQTAKARFVLDKVIQQYGSTPSAQKAEAELQALPAAKK
ncbi:MAG: tol-pal system protein YbgF [Acidithiobacillus sp.]